jgi:hypothetical protein
MPCRSKTLLRWLKLSEPIPAAAGRSELTVSGLILTYFSLNEALLLVRLKVSARVAKCALNALSTPLLTERSLVSGAGYPSVSAGGFVESGLWLAVSPLLNRSHKTF